MYEAMQAAGHILNNVDILVGVARSSDDRQVFLLHHKAGAAQLILGYT